MSSDVTVTRQVVRALLAVDGERALSRVELLKRYLAMSAISIALKLDPKVFDVLAAFFEWQMRERTVRRPLVGEIRVLRVKGSDGSFTCTGRGGWHGTV